MDSQYSVVSCWINRENYYRSGFIQYRIKLCVYRALKVNTSIHHMATLQSLTEGHNLIGETKFHFKSWLHIVSRQAVNIISPIPKFYDKGLLKDQSVIASSESNLWNADDNPENWILTAGKIENLRIAVKCINGIE